MRPWPSLGLTPHPRASAAVSSNEMSTCIPLRVNTWVMKMPSVTSEHVDTGALGKERRYELPRAAEVVERGAGRLRHRPIEHEADPVAAAFHPKHRFRHLGSALRMHAHRNQGVRLKAVSSAAR